MFKTLILLAFIFAISVQCDKQLGDLLKDLEAKIYNYQIMKHQAYQPPFKWEEKAGLFKSDIRINLVGDPIITELRNGKIAAIFDNDMFSTGWILATLLDISLYGTGVPNLDYNRLKFALGSINDYQNKNDDNYRITPIRSFWPQVYNSTYDIWQQQPDNIRNIILNVDNLPWGEIEKFLDALHLDKVAQMIEEFRSESSIAISAFQIPPDFDDTYLNVGIGATLLKLNKLYGPIYNEWSKNNSNFNELIEKTVKYAYRPFDKNSEQNIIDPRTYFYARPFLLDAQKNNASFALITTWIQDIDEQRDRHKKGVSMPFNVNNVDVTVCANSIYGIASAAITDLNGFQTMFQQSPDIQQVFLNTTKFISWAIEANFTGRPDLAQVYYPSTFNFLWYASRTLFLLENEFQAGTIPKLLQGVFAEAKGYLKQAFQDGATQFFLSKVQKDDKGHLFFEDFLGTDDTNIFGKKHPTGEDRIFSTAQAINTLFCTWTYQDPLVKKLVWKTETPDVVKTLLHASVNWLKTNVLDKNIKPLNAFFSGSVKGFTSLPFWYPTNYQQFLNGTNVDPNNLPEDQFGNVIFGVSGTIDEATYQKMLQQQHFGQNTPIDFHGYNEKGNFFPFWSSEPYTYSVSLLALSLFNNLVE